MGHLSVKKLGEKKAANNDLTKTLESSVNSQSARKRAKRHASHLLDEKKEKKESGDGHYYRSGGLTGNDKGWVR